MERLRWLVRENQNMFHEKKREKKETSEKQIYRTALNAGPGGLGPYIFFVLYLDYFMYLLAPNLI